MKNLSDQFSSNTWYYSLAFLFLLYFLFWGTYRIQYLPGLHGDEAWVGLKALLYNEVGIEKLTGMNSYTGIIEPYLTSVSFKFFGNGIAQLRIVGVILNLFAVILILIAAKTPNERKIVLVTLFILSQSLFFLISTRIAWEVNSLTLLFTILFIVSLRKLFQRESQSSIFWQAVFLLTNLIGSYNHIIFSCLSLASMITVSFWFLRNNSGRYFVLAYLNTVNLLNVTVLHLCLKYFSKELYDNWIYGVLATALLLSFQLSLSSKVQQFKFTIRHQKLLRVFELSMLVSALIIFVFYHGYAVFQMLATNNVFTHFFSYEPSLFAKSVYILVGASFLAYFYGA